MAGVRNRHELSSPNGAVELLGDAQRGALVLLRPDEQRRHLRSAPGASSGRRWPWRRRRARVWRDACRPRLHRARRRSLDPAAARTGPAAMARSPAASRSPGRPRARASVHTRPEAASPSTRRKCQRGSATGRTRGEVGRARARACRPTRARRRGPGAAQGADQPGERMGIRRDTENARGIRRAARAGLVPGDHVERIVQPFELRPPHAAVGSGPVQQHQRRPGPRAGGRRAPTRRPECVRAPGDSASPITAMLGERLGSVP